MAYSGKKTSYNVVKIQKAPLVACLMCPLCNNILREATTISECLHTFCEECIHERLVDDEMNDCPICNVSLGCLPLEKLRVDNQLRELRAKLFPVGTRKRSMPSSGTSASVPIRRKERSLSSLGVVSISSLSNTTNIVQKGKSIVATNHPSKELFLNERQNTRGEKGSKSSRGTGDGERFAKELTNEDDRSHSESTKSTKLKEKALASSMALTDSSSHDSEDPSILRREPGTGMYVVDHSEAVGLLAFSQTGVGHLENVHPYQSSRYSSENKHTQAFSQNGKVRPMEFDDLPSLAYLAEVAEADANKSATLTNARKSLSFLSVEGKFLVEEEPSKRVRHMQRAKSESERRDCWKSPVAEVRVSSPFIKKLNPDLHGMSLDTAPTKIRSKPEALKKQMVHSKATSFSLAIPDRKFTDVWFALKAAENQMEDGALRQISTPYIRMKDGRLPVSIVKKYLARKLDLQSETEVEIKCNGQTVISSLPLESVQTIWLAALSGAKPLLHKKKISVRQSCSLSQNDTPLDALMVLTYGRSRRTIVRNPSTVRP